LQPNAKQASAKPASKPEETKQ
jgi:hypothetical protein